ncbi:hypothetical protein [Rhodococcus tukisamuensis]|uniref:hypothetical protein n=1 Tax=Rhodococcus tukisamuensis TaxID=168276 RepID=UPI001FE07483|nr:hypothetical protein [Rhodococcus tukisamuensis]
MIVTVPGCSPTTATQRIEGTSRLPYGFPNGAGLIWNGTVTAAEATAAGVRTEPATMAAQATDRRTKSIMATSKKSIAVQGNPAGKGFVITNN